MIVRSLKSPLGLIALGALTLSIHSVFAQSVGPVNNPLGQTIAMQAGKYNFEKYQKDAVFLEHVKKLNQRSEEAAALYKETIKEFSDAFAAYTSFINGTLVKAANDSLVTSYNPQTKKGGPITAADYLELIRQYNEKQNLVTVKIKAVATFSEGLKSRIITDAGTSGVNSVATVADGLKLDKLAATFLDAMKEIEKVIPNQQVAVKTKLNAVKTVALLDATWVKMEYTPEEIAGIQEEIDTIKYANASQKTKLKTYTNFVISLIQVVQATYGTSEKWRQNGRDATYFNARKDAVKQIAEAFWQRSYFRMRYGVNLGAVGIKYNKQVLKLDRFLADMTSMEFYSPANDQKTVISLENQMMELFQTSSQKGKNLSDILHGKVDLLSSVNTAVSFAMGTNEIAKVWNMLAGMMMNDIAEEKMLFQGRRDDVVRAYAKRYYSTTPNPANPEGLSDREHFLMQEFMLDYNQKRMDAAVEKKLIPRRVTRVSSPGKETLIGQGLEALGVGRERLAAMTKVAALEAVINDWNEANGEAVGNDTLDDILGLDN